MTLPAYQMPGPLDFSGMTNALARYNDSSWKQAQLDNERTRIGFEGERLGMEKGRFAREERDDKMKSLVGSVLAVNQEQDPGRRQQMLGQILAQHPDPAMRTHPVFSDPVKGPAALMADLQAHGINPYALAQTQAGLAHTQAQTAATVGSERRADQMQPLDILAKQKTIEAAKFGKTKEDEDLYVQDPSSPTGVRYIPKPQNPDGQSAAYRKALDKERGEARAKAETSLPGIVDTSERALKTIAQIRTHPGRKYGTGAAGMIAPHLPNTDARGFANLVDQAKGQTFLEAYNSLRGGGAITEAEGKKAEQAFARLDRAQSGADFDAALIDLEDVIRTGTARAHKAAGITQGQATGPSVPRQYTDRLPQGGAPETGAQGQIPPDAVRHLMSNPTLEMRRYFDEKYGVGRAAQLLQAR